MVKKSSFGQTSSAGRGLVFMPNRGLLEFLSFPEIAHRSRPGLNAKPRPLPDMSRVLVFDGFWVSERLGDDRGWVRDVVQ